MDNDKFYKEFREVYEAINIIGKEIMGMKKRIEDIDNNVNEIKQKIDSCCQKPQPQAKKDTTAPEEDPERKAARDKYVRSRTGDFEPGDKDIDVDNVFYTGSKKRV